MTINRISNTQHGPARLPKPCKFCGTLGHSAFNCPKKPRKELTTKKRLTTRSRLNKMGKQGAKWIETRNIWFKLHTAQSYVCYLCGKVLAREETTLDHIKSRGRYPELRYDLTNLAPCCFQCNERKGSLSVEEFKKKLEGDHAH